MATIFGFHHAAKADVVVQPARCGKCSATGVGLTSYTAQEWLGVCGLPLIPRGRVRIVRRCSACGRFERFLLDGPRRRLAIHEATRRAKENFGGDRAAMLDGIVTLAHVDDVPAAEALVGELSDTGDELGVALACAKLSALQGQPDEAQRHYLAAMNLAPADPLPRAEYARFLLGAGRREEAAAEFRQAAALAPALAEDADFVAAVAKTDGGQGQLRPRFGLPASE